MLFHSAEYLLFLPLVVTLHYLLPHRWRWVMLLAASYLFYSAWRVEFLPILILSTLVDYLVGRQLHSEQRVAIRKLLVSVSVCVNIGLLAYFKYLATGWKLVGAWLLEWRIIHDFSPLDIILPLGISFYTFQTLSYTIDIYRRRIKPERHIGYFATYVAFFPQLLAGPIERASQLLPRLRSERPLLKINILSGLGLILLGFFKKLVIAEHLSRLTTPITINPSSFSPSEIIVTPPLVMYQFYCDLSGYADIALGSAMLLGVKLAKNFARPFVATSITHFWFRWHITVTLWFRDYVLMPIAGRRPTLIRRTIAIILTGLLVGLWHGATLGWLVAGLSVGIMSIIENRWRRWRVKRPPMSPFNKKVSSLAGWLYVWLMFSYVIGIPVAFGSISGLSLAYDSVIQKWSTGEFYFPFSQRYKLLAFLCLSIIVLELWQWLEEKQFARATLTGLSTKWVVVIFGVIAMFILMFGNLESQEFMYFNF